MKTYVLAAKCFIVFLAVTIIALGSVYRVGISPVDKNNTELKDIVVGEGSTWYSISSDLLENNIIKSEKFYKIYIKLFRPGKLEIGTYKLSSSMSMDEIVETLEKGSTVNPYDVNVTFREGLNMRSIAKLIADNTDNSTDDVYNTLKDSEYIDSLIEKYWFLTDDIKNTNIYYSLEGYLYPNTYNLNKKSSVKDIFKVMLDETDKVLSQYKDDFNGGKLKSIHEYITLASIVELEAGKADDRSSVAGVFYNRLDKGITLGSDVTAYYAYKMDDWTHGLTMDQIKGCNSYNTRGTCVKGLPVGPICNPSIESIKAVLNPKIGDYLFFVADCSGKTYLTKTNAEHESIIKKLKSENNWCDN